MIITDFSQIALAPIHVDGAAQQCAMNPSPENKGFIKHFMLNSIRSNFVTHKSKYGQMVIATDSNKGYWRRDYFEHYKIQRRTARKNNQSDIDWNFVHEIIDELINDLEVHFPFPVIRVPGAEGDDIIGTLTKLVSTDPTYFTEDAFGDTEAEPVLILSTDRDNSQLHKYTNVRQWSPRDKKLIKPDGGWRAALVEKIIKGESGASSDSIPNLRSPDDIFLQEGVRQKPIATTRVQQFIEAHKGGDIASACLDEEERKNLIRNQTLVDYEFIPEHVKTDIIACYNLQVAKKTSRMGLMNYFTKNRMSNLLGNITDFYL